MYTLHHPPTTLTSPSEPRDYDNNLQGWVLSIASGLACCLGASVVFSDLILQRFSRTQRIVQNTSFLVASLSLGSGVLLFSSLYSLLPEAKVYSDASPLVSEYSGFYIITFYFLGVLGSTLINRKANSQSITSESNLPENTERSPLLPKIHDHSLKNKESVNYVYRGDNDENDGIGCGQHSLAIEDDNNNDYSGNQQKDAEELMKIGIQSALAISIHKFPEGLITFITSQASPSLGFALFLAIAIHNISEGFTIALPLYMATKSRIKSFLYASLLGGLSQPFGALLGWAFIRESYLEHWDVNAVYGGLFACVSGLMTVIVIQGMLPQAIKNDTSGGTLVNIFFFLGMFAMGLSSALFTI
ncbi:12114_t:CDS:2 [Ambispora leptoticha]|uniref:12114_t:CDS:1 n=1 Tax=Ambispora leptoticha TaxID=144679 RepID=A0A9N8Z4H1_9GLOM|nr:12114_t:CDS:2 [Ambispora leptoticha]